MGKIILILVLLIGNSFGQTNKLKDVSIFPSATTVLDSLEQNYKRIEDYYVRIDVSIKTPMLRMPKKRVEFWFKQPNLTKVETKGFAAIPKSGIISSPIDLFDNLSDIAVVGAEYLNEKQVWILRGELNPDSLTFKNMGEMSSAHNLKMRLYIDRGNWTLIKSETWMDTLKVAEISSEYTTFKNGIHLPKETVINFQYSGGLPSGIESFHSDDPIINMKKDAMMDMEMMEKLSEKEMKGIITLKFSKYKVNQGLERQFFTGEEPE